MLLSVQGHGTRVEGGLGALGSSYSLPWVGSIVVVVLFSCCCRETKKRARVESSNPDTPSGRG